MFDTQANARIRKVFNTTWNAVDMATLTLSNLAIDPLSGNATLNAIPVEITLARRSEPATAIPVAD